MAQLKISEELITRFVNLKKAEERTLIIQKALDGTEYLTRFGRPYVYYDLTVYVDEAGVNKLNLAADILSLLEVCVNKGVFYGRIIEISDFEYLAGGFYKGEIRLSNESEVSNR